MYLLMRLVLLLCLFWTIQPAFAQTNYYTVKFPDDKTYIGCNASTTIDYPVITQYSCNTNVGVSRYDEVFATNEPGSCYKILRRWRLLYWCDYNPNTMQPTVIPNPTNSDVGATAIGNAANHGYLEYTQIIKVRDDNPPVFTSCPASPVVFCDYTNNNTALYGNTCEGPVELTTEATDACSGTDIAFTYRLFLDLDGNGSMETYIYSGGPNSWPVEKTLDSNKVKARIAFPANYQLPYGNHKVEWVANDNCGNEAICKYEFIVKDCKNPTVVCMNGLSVNIMQTGMISLDDTDFIQFLQDNCTPANALQIGIRKANTGTGFPANSHTVNFDCTEIGTQPLEVWVKDAGGNADFCLTYVIIQDNSNTCAPTSSLSGSVMKQTGGAMQNVNITALKANNQSAGTTLSLENGNFGPIALWPGCYNLTASGGNNDNINAGIDTWDALLASLHAEAVTYFDQAWQYAAADVNGDGWITPEDGWAIVQVAIGGSNAWPVAPNWQFIGANNTIPQDQLPPTGVQQVCIPVGASTFNWLAVKTGDIDNSPTETGNKLTTTISKRTATFSALDQEFEAGSTVALTLNAPSVAGLAGFQFTLDYNPAVLQVADIQSVGGGLEHVQTARFDQEHQITAGWQNAIAFYPDGAAMFTGKSAMTIVFHTLQAGKLSDVVSMNNQRITTEVYTRDLARYNAKLAFSNASNKGSVQLFPVSPDPTTGDEIMVRFDLPSAMETRLQVIDEFGRLVATKTVTGASGYQEVPLTINVRRSGTYTLQLVTAQGIFNDKIIINKG